MDSGPAPHKRLVRNDNIKNDLALYIHWPFCVSKCPYCDFNSHVREAINHTRWRAAYLRELEHYAALTEGRRLTSIFFGGGTPSLMEAETVAAIIDKAAALWPVAPDIEITAEANPGSVDQAVFQGFAAAGVNRVSLGVQSFDGQALKFLGRQHSGDEARAAIALAAKYFPRFSFDLIYALPGQGLRDWQTQLEEALGYAPQHLSAYQLTIEQGTKFEGLYRQGAFVLPAPELAADLYETTAARLAAAGLHAYEISNYAAPGHESRHNLAYWRYSDYIGVGPGAHGRITDSLLSPSSRAKARDPSDGPQSNTMDSGPAPHRDALRLVRNDDLKEKFATRAHRAPELWLERVEEHGHGADAPVPLSPQERFEEMLMMGLRLAEPIPFARIESETGRGLFEWLDEENVRRLETAGFITLNDIGIAGTVAGRQVLNEVLKSLL
jgi:oxygen-independent coproporphyrinogen-3 oxidase